MILFFVTTASLAWYLLPSEKEKECKAKSVSTLNILTTETEAQKFCQSQIYGCYEVCKANFSKNCQKCCYQNLVDSCISGL